ncbi:hypothetical protein Tco_0885016, partial [Tanacetum coccineum]
EDDVDIEEDDEEEEHPALVDSTAVALPAVDHAPSAEETEPFETDESAATPPPHPAYQVTARISIRDELPTPFWSDTEIPSPPLPPILSPLPILPPLHVSSPPPASPTYPLRYRAVMIRLRAEAPSTSHSPPPHIILSHTRADTPPSGTSPLGTPPLLPIPLPTSSPPLHLPSADHGADRPEQAVITELQAVDRRRQASITELLAADRRRQAQFVEALKLLKVLQTQMIEFERQQGPAKGPAQPDAPEEAGSSSYIMTTRLNPETTTTTPTTTSVTNAQLKAMIDQGVTAAQAARDANTNGVDSHNSGNRC